MPIKHLVARVDTLLEQSAEYLDDLFSTKNGQAKVNLLINKEAGDIFIGSSGCKTFDPKKGCLCGEEVPEYDPEYLEECIERASKTWKGVEPNEWLEEYRK